MAKKKKSTIVWKDGFRYSKLCDPVVASKALAEIRESNSGDLRPEMIPPVAKAKDHPLHPFFEWDNRKAADAHRVIQAARIIRSIEVVTVEAPKYPTRKWELSVSKKANGRPYKPIEEIMENPEDRAAMLQRALGELVAARRKYAALQELSIVFRAIDEALETIKP